MLTFPSFPTDNLYKFLSIAGLLTYLLSSYYSYTKFNEYQSSLIEHNIIIDKSNATGKKLLQTVQDENEVVKSISNELKQGKFDSTKNAKFDSGYKITLGDIENYETALLSEKGLSAKLDIQREELNTILSYCDWGIRIGRAFMFFGFLFWYMKIQKPQDIFEKNKLIENPEYQEFCQSCLKDLRFKKDRGREVNDIFNPEFCNDCYIRGEFAEPTLTYFEARKRLNNLLAVNNKGFFQALCSNFILAYSKRWRGTF